MEASTIDPGLLQLTEIILTAEAVNTNPALEVNDLPPHLRAMFCPEAAGVIARPVTITFPKPRSTPALREQQELLLNCK